MDIQHINADNPFDPYCAFCGNRIASGVFCDRCARIQAYANEVGAEFAGFQGRNVVMRDRDGNEFVVWSETFDRQ